MGGSQTKTMSRPVSTERVVEGLKNKVGLLQVEINEIMRIRDAENQAYGQELMVFAFKQAEWKRERKTLKEEVKKLSKILEEKQDHHENNDGHELEYLMGTSSCMLEHIKEEQKRRDETVEKWKQLYFAIKVELDHLIQRTHQEERLCWKRSEEEDIIVELKKEVKAKEERIGILQAKLASMEHQQSKKEREMDILRQSLRIMSHKRRATAKLGQRSSQGF